MAVYPTQNGTTRRSPLKIKRMNLMWGDLVSMGEDLKDGCDVKIVNKPFRADGPAVVTLAGLHKWHREGDLHRPYKNGKNFAIRCDLAQFRWFTNEKTPGLMYRTCGPMELSLYDVKIFHDEDTDIPLAKKFTFGRIGFRWNTHGGTVITERNAYAALEGVACGETDKYNLLTTKDSIFLDSLDEFLFWQEVDVD